MITKAIISTFLIVLGWASFSAGQGADQATMRVSVKVVSGSSVELVQPDVVSLIQGSESSLGMLKMKGSKDILVNSTSTLTLRNKDGEELEMNVRSQRGESESGQQSISFEGLSNDKMMSSVYQGSLTTTIEYL